MYLAFSNSRQIRYQWICFGTTLSVTYVKPCYLSDWYRRSNYLDIYQHFYVKTQYQDLVLSCHWEAIPVKYRNCGTVELPSKYQNRDQT